MPSKKKSSVYTAIAGTTGLAVDAFYRRVALPGSVPITTHGPILLVANHPNGLIDPIVVSNVVRDERTSPGQSPRQIRMLAKAPLFKMPGVSWLVRGAGALPVYRAKDGADTAQNQATFQAVNDALCQGSTVLIFPEGISHHEPKVQKLKTGAARMALQACAAGARELVVIPIGLVYRDKARFRSEVATLVGAPLPVASYLDDEAGPDDPEAVRRLTDDIAEALERNTVNLSTWEDLPLLEAVDAIWRLEDPMRTARLKRLADGVARLHHRAPAVLEATRARVAAWTRRLEELGLTPRDLSPEHEAARKQPRVAAWFVAKNLAVAWAGLPVALCGAAFFAVPFWSVHFLWWLTRPPPDVAATVKVLSSLVLFPLWHLAATAALWRMAGPGMALAVAGLSPLAGMTSRWFFRGRARALRDAAAFLSMLLRRDLVRTLEAERDAVVAEIERVASQVESLDVGPQSG